ncbi:hypothetical protein G9A89_004386 [Geosiphon pyriformis]|nr:hypothetical protein G9A89_004386 [Geosiphon pyriformis]
MEVVFEHQVTGIILQRTSTDNTKPKVAESEIIGTNHLGFAKALFQQYSQQLGLTNNYYPAESAFNFYVNERITDFLGRPVDIESARKNFYSELIQHTNLSRNHSFAPIIKEINQEIERYTQKTFPITYQDKGKEKLQTPAVTPKGIQISNWKKQRIESPIYSLYHHTPESTINIVSADASTSTKTLLARIAFQRAYSDYFEGFKSRLSIPLGFQSPPHQPDFGTEFNYQNPILEDWNIQTQQHLENLEIKMPNIRILPNQRNQNPKLINQQNLPLVIVINQPPINPIAKPIQQPLQLSFQQLPSQPPNLDPITYIPIAKLDNFTVWLNDIEKAITANRWNDAQAMQAIFYFLKDTANSWYQSLVNKPQDFNAFKVEFLRYFSNNNSINCLVNIFTTMKQGETEAILNQFIHGLCSSILQHVCPLHPGILQDTVTHARDFESAESETNHAQAVNLVMNKSSELDSKLEKFSKSINKRLEEYLADNHTIYQPPQQCNNQGNSNRAQNQPLPKSKPTHLPTSDAVISLLISSVSSSNLSTAATSNLSTTTVTNNLLTPTNPNTTPKLTTQQNPKTKNNSTELEIGDGSSSTDPQFFTATIWIMPVEFGCWSTPEPEFPKLFNNIPPATVTNDKLLDAIFSFKLEEPSTISLFSGAALEEKPITIMYTDV